MRLVQGSALLLLDHARPEALGALVRGLLPTFPEVEVLTSAGDLLDVERGSTLVLCLDPREAEWVNFERPMFAERALKVVLFSPKRVSDVYARRAPDFFNWITRYVECPALPSAPAVHGLKKAQRCPQALGVQWTGGDLDAAFARALPGERMVRLSASIAHDEMVKAAAETADWIAWQDVDGPFRLRRVTWSGAEARRKGRVILERPTVASPGYWPVNGRVAPIAKARETLKKAGALHPGRLAALLELEPEALRLAAAWLRAGGSAAEIEERALHAEDGGAVAAHLALERRIAHERPTPAILRSTGGGSLWLPQDDVRERLVKPPEERGSWANLATSAIEAGDPRIGLLWAQRGLTEDLDTAEAWKAWGRALFVRGLTREALKSLELAALGAEDASPTPAVLTARASLAGMRVRLHLETPDDIALLEQAAEQARKNGLRTASTVEALQSFGLACSMRGDSAGAFKALEDALRIEKNLPARERKKILTSHYGLAMVLQTRGMLGEAEASVRRALAETRDVQGDEHPHTATCLQGLGALLVARGGARAGLPCLERALTLKKRLYGDEHPSTASAFQELGKAWTAVGDFERAESLLQTARRYRLDALGEKSPDLAETLDALGRLKQKQGRHAEAEALFRQATEIRASALGPVHPETLESVQGLSSVAGDKADRYQSIDEFLDELPRRMSSKSEPPSRHTTMKNFFMAQHVLRVRQLLASLEPHGPALRFLGRGSRWLLFKPLSIFFERIDQSLCELMSDRDNAENHQTRVFQSILGVMLAVIARMADRDNAPQLARSAVQRVQEIFGHDHVFTRDVEAELGEGADLHR